MNVGTLSLEVKDFRNTNGKISTSDAYIDVSGTSKFESNCRG